MSATSRWETIPASGEHGGRPVGIVGVDMDLERRLITDDEHRVAVALELGDEAPRLQTRSGDGEVGAVAKRARLVLGVGHAGGGLVLDLRRLAAAQRADDPGQQHGERVAPGVDDSRLAQHREQIWAPLHGLIAGGERPLDHFGDDGVLLDRRLVSGPSRRTSMWASSDATRAAISRTTVRIVPSAGWRTEP